MARSVVFVLVVVSLAAFALRAQQGSDEVWRFAVSGDSRNCGDVVMPAIAKSVLEHNVEFYWHLGDFRLGYDIDEDMKQLSGGELSLSDYQQQAWDDFIEHQIGPFKPLTVYLGIGNHELYMHGWTDKDEDLSHEEFITKFRKWMEMSTTAYYHWELKHVDFITLDNSRNAGFDPDQLKWLKTELDDDSKTTSGINTVVVGMHRALPNSLACGHSMNGDPTSSAEDNFRSLKSGRRAYADLWNFQNSTGKHVYVLASHSHFYMENIFNTDYWNNKNEKDNEVLNGRRAEAILQGWLIGTAGAVRYRLPDGLPPKTLAVTGSYGYLLGTVNSDGTIGFEFHQVTEDDVPPEIKSKYCKDFVDFCFLANREDKPHVPEQSCNEQ